MNNFSKNWHKSLVEQCEDKLGRLLTEAERNFICSRGSGIALEFIQNSVSSLDGDELTSYLNSENKD